MEALNTAEASMMIRRPVEEVYNAFIDPDITCKFWFTDSTGKLEEGKKLTWTWAMYDVSAPLQVLKLAQNKEILISWGEAEQASKVSWEFQAIESNTFVRIKNFDFQSSGDTLHRQICDSVGGFTMVLAGLKAYLEHGIVLNLVGDKWPKEMQ